MYTTPIAFLLLFIVATQCTHFRGGTISWTTNKNTHTVSFTVTTYWNASFIPDSLDLEFGDGSQHTTTDFEITKWSEFATLVFKTQHEYAEAGTYIATFSECCRIEQLRGHAGGYPNLLVAKVVVDDVYRQSPSVLVPPVVQFKIGYNFYRVQSTLPVESWEFSNPSISGLPYSWETGIFEAEYVPTLSPKGAKFADFEWTTTDDDVGLWAVSVYVSTLSGSYTIDFLVNVINEYTIPNPPYIQITPPKTYYGLSDGQSASFTVVCPHTDSNVKYQLSTPIAYTGLTFNQQAVSVYDVDANVPITVDYTPKPDYSYADNIQYPVTLICTEIDNKYTTYVTVVVSVGKPLVLTPPVSKPVDCIFPCKCLDLNETATYTDGCCGLANVSYTDVLPPNSCNTQVTRKWYAINECGQEAWATQIIYVNDQTPPVISKTGFGDLTQQCPTLSIATPPARDVCSAVTINTTITPPLSSACVQTVVRRWTATDGCGNQATHSQTINIRDNTPPRLLKTVETNTFKRDCPFQSTAFDGVVRGADNCGRPVNVTFVDVNRPPCGKWTRTFTGVDTCDNKATLSIDIEISHTNLPTITIPPNYGTYQCPADVARSPVPNATGFCGENLRVTLVRDETFRDPYSKCPTSVVRTWTTTDPCGNVRIVNETIPLRDVTPPTICVPPNVAVECVYGAQCKKPCAEYYLPANTGGSAHATDLCGDNVTITYNDVFIPGNCAYTTTSSKINRTWTATDVCGNSVSKSQIITIIDTTAPEFCPPPDFEGQCPSDIANAPYPNGLSDCNTANVSHSDKIIYQTYGICEDVTILRTYTVYDVCGNSAYSNQTITIRDTKRPNITVPCDAVVECKPKAYNLTATGTATGTDNCKMGKKATYVDVITTDEYIIREWTVYDACGNTRKGNQTIRFNNTIPDITCPADITVSCYDATYPNVTGCATANDLCSGTIIPYHSDAESGTCPRVITRTWYAYNDITKKTATCEQKITVWHDEGPHLKVPTDQTVQCPYQAIPENTGSACAGRFCVDEPFTTPNYTDGYHGFPCKPEYAIKRTWSTKDDCNRTSEGVQTIYIHDTTPPAIVVPNECFVQCRLNISTALCGSAYVYDNCDVDKQYATLTYVDSLPSDKHNCPSTVLRVWSAVDCSGNKASVEQPITITETGPVFDPYLPKTLPPIECVDCLSFNDIYATGSCGEQIKAVPTITKDGLCPTTVTITWVARDDCGRESVFVQTVLVEDKTRPTLDTYDLKDLTVECDAEIPTYGVVHASDNCPLVGKPTFTDRFVPGNCTCDSCTKVLERTWVVRDRCGLVSDTFVQRIISVKTKNPTINVPDVSAIPCGSAESADDDGTGYATAFDSCGSPLFVTYVDKRYILDDGTIQITRTWSTSDNCNHVAEADQIIAVKTTTYDDKYQFVVPPTRRLGCGGNIHADELKFPSYNSYNTDHNSDLYASSPCGAITVTNSMDDKCNIAEPGKYTRTWNAVLNGKVFDTKTQDIYVADCPSYGSGISGLPTSPLTVSYGNPAQVTPSFTIYDLDIPCDKFTVTWTFGTGQPHTYVCDPHVTNTHCKFDQYKSSLTVSASQNYTAAGVYDVTVKVSGQRSYGANDAYGKGTVVTADRYKGTVSGVTELDYTNDDIVVSPPQYGGEYTPPKYSCVKPWIILVPDAYTPGKYTSAHCAGKPKVDFSSSFLPDAYSGAVSVTGSVSFKWEECYSISFNGTVKNLGVYPGRSGAVLTGKIVYNKAPTANFNFSLFTVDGGKYGDSLHFRVIEVATGLVIFDTDPCMPAIIDKEEPTADPVNYVHPDSSIDVYTPSSEQVAALVGETPGTTPGDSTPDAPSPAKPGSSSSVGTIVGIVVGIMVFVVVVAIIVFVLLKQQQQSKYSTQGSSFIPM